MGLPYDVGAVSRIVAALEQAEHEGPLLAAPDGTVAVKIEDLRAMVDKMDHMRDTLALGKMFWRERWYGSAPFKGSSIVTEGGQTIAYLGGNEETHSEVSKIVAAHNAALNESMSA